MARWPVALTLLIVGGLGGALLTNSGLEGQAPAPAVYPKELTSYRDVVKRVLPAVVSVESSSRPMTKAKQSGPRRQRAPRAELPPGIPEQFRKFFEDMDGSEGEIPQDSNPRHAFGSG